jgi:hypothetical protein
VLQTAATDVPRFDHDPTTGESLGLLVEEQRTNLLIRSEELDDAAWTKGGSTISANATVAPTGATIADKIAEDNSNSSHRIISTAPSWAASTAYTYSFYAKAGERTQAYGLIGTTAVASRLLVIFDLLTGVPTTSSGSPTAISMVNVGNGWYRCFITFTSSASPSGSVLAGIWNTAEIYTGTTGSGLFFWGADLQAGASPTGYIPTTTAAVTRSASLADLISSAIANNIRTLYLEFRSPASGTRGVASLNDNTANERASVLASGTGPRLVVVDGGVEQANVNGGTVTANQRTRVAVRINANDFAISINGGAVVTDTSGTLPTVDRLMLGRTQAGEYLNGTLARVTGWTQLLPDSTMQFLAQ